MKHQLYRQGTYVEINIGMSHLQIVGKVKNSTIVNKRIVCEEIFNIPQQSIELEMSILAIYEDPDITPKLIEDPFFIKGMVEGMNGIKWENGKLYTSVEDLSVPDEELKKLFYTLKQGAKQT